jgi:hypothetical protein
MNQQASASRGGLFLSAALLGAGFVVGGFATAFHPSGIDPNNHPLVFVQYAHSAGWTADHLVWFVSTTLTIAGLLVLIDALNLNSGMARILNRIGMVLGSAAIAMTALRDAVDGVVLKRAVDAWVSAPTGEQAARYASAEVARWMEEASASYQYFLFGLTLLVLAALIVWSGRVPRPIGFLFAISGLASFVVGWILGEAGFAPEGANPSYVTEFVPVICAVYLLVVAWRIPQRGAERSPGAYVAQPERA